MNPFLRLTREQYHKIHSEKIKALARGNEMKILRQDSLQ
jgi:hypothetical protein